MKSPPRPAAAPVDVLEAGLYAFNSMRNITYSLYRLFLIFPHSVFAPIGIRDEMVRSGLLPDDDHAMATVESSLFRLERKAVIERVSVQGQMFFRAPLHI